MPFFIKAGTYPHFYAYKKLKQQLRNSNIESTKSNLIIAGATMNFEAQTLFPEGSSLSVPFHSLLLE